MNSASRASGQTIALSRLDRVLIGVCTLLLLPVSVALGVMMQAPEATPVPTPTPSVTITTPSWAQGCGSDADCAAVEARLNSVGLYLTGDGEVTATPPLSEDDPDWNCATMGNGICGPIPEQCVWPTDGTDPPLPCTNGPVSPLTDTHGVEHAECAVILLTAEDVVMRCSDGYTE